MTGWVVPFRLRHEIGRSHELPTDHPAAERDTLTLLRRQGLCAATIARILGRHRSTIGREVRRNTTRHDGWYRAEKAHSYATARRASSRRNQRFGPADWRVVQARLADEWSPEQIAGRLALEGTLSISHETIYRHIGDDRARGGVRYLQLRGARKQRRKRYGRYDSRGRLAGKRPIADRPAAATARTVLGHWEGDTVLSAGRAGPCVLTLVERKTGFVAIGKLTQRTGAPVNRRARRLIAAQPHPVRTITVDNGTEFHHHAQSPPPQTAGLSHPGGMRCPLTVTVALHT